MTDGSSAPDAQESPPRRAAAASRPAGEGGPDDRPGDRSPFVAVPQFGPLRESAVPPQWIAPTQAPPPPEHYQQPRHDRRPPQHATSAPQVPAPYVPPSVPPSSVPPSSVPAPYVPAAVPASYDPSGYQQGGHQQGGYEQAGPLQEPRRPPQHELTAPEPYTYAPQHQQPAPPRPEDLLVPNRPSTFDEPASWGWRGRLNRASGGLVKPKAAPQEVMVRRAIAGIQRGFSKPMTVVVVQPKGGAGKTPTTICLSAAFGAYRGGYVVGWDDNETRGTLAVRVENPDDKRATVWDLLSDLSAFERFDARVGDLGYYVRSQPDSHFDALVSDDNPGNMAQIGDEEFRRLHTVLQRFYRMIVVDTGNNVRSPNWQAAVSAADLVVVVSTYQRDVGYSGSWVLDHLAQTGREELARNAVTVLTAGDPTTDKTVREQLLQHFAARTRAVIEVPFDPEIAHGGPIRWNHLSPATRNAWTIAGATVVDALVASDVRAMEERRI